MDRIFFETEKKEYCIPFTDVEEVIKKEKISSISGMPKFVLGYFTMNGSIYSLLSLSRLAAQLKEKDRKKLRMVKKRESEDNIMDLAQYFILLKHEKHKLAIPATMVNHSGNSSCRLIDSETIAALLERLETKTREESKNNE